MPQIASGGVATAKMKLDVGGGWHKVAGGFVDHSHGALSNQAAHKVFGSPAHISATSPASLTEATLNGATVTVSLGGVTFASGVSASSFALVTHPAPPVV